MKLTEVGDLTQTLCEAVHPAARLTNIHRVHPMTNRFEFKQMSDFIKARPPSNQVADLLQDAAACAAVRNWTGACWRLADASFLLRRKLERQGSAEVQGLDTPSGMGAIIGGAKTGP